MPLGTTTFWACVLPSEKINQALNPSFERGTLGAGAVQGAGLGSSSDFQTFGAYSLFITPTSNGTSGAFLGTVTTGSGTDYTASAYVRGSAGVGYMIAVADTSNVLVGSALFTGGGTWQRYSVAYSENSNTTRRVIVRKANSANPASTGTVYVDGWQFEVGSITTYIDGDQDGCTWLGASHASQSYRSGQTRSGGSVVALQDLGLIIDETPGIGMPPLENSSQSYAVIGGAQFQRTRAATRPFTFHVSIPGQSLQDMHRLRRQAINAFKIDAVTPQQPTRFWYTGAGGTVQIDAVLDAGLEFDSRAGFMETAALRFVAYDPYWESTTQQGTTLAPRVNLGSTNYVAKRDTHGQWGTLGINGTTFQNSQGVFASLINQGGTVFFGGKFGTAGGTQANNIALYSPYTGLFGTLDGGTLSSTGSVNALAQSAAGSIYVGGNFALAGGTAISNIAQWNGAWGSLSNGTLSNASGHQVRTLLYSSGGTLFIGGTFASINGTVAKNIALWNGVAGGTLTNGTIAQDVVALAEGKDKRIYAGGLFLTAGGTSARGMAMWNGSWGTLAGGTIDNTLISAIAVGADGRVYFGGQFTTIANATSSGTYNNIAVWNGVGFAPLANGLSAANPSVLDILTNQLDNTIYVGGVFNAAGSVGLNDSLAQWNGYIFQSTDINLPGNGTISTMCVGADTTFYIGGPFTGTATAAAVAPIVNLGMAQVYPTISFYNNSSGTANITKLVNTTTSDGLYFSLQLLPQERATLVLNPGNRSFQSITRGNIFNTIQPGSNLSTWRLIPGTNYIMFLADNDGLQTTMTWSPRHWSADAGTVFP